MEVLIPPNLGIKWANKAQLKWSKGERGKNLLHSYTKCWTWSCLLTQRWDIRVTTGSSATTSIHWRVLFQNINQMLHIKKGLQSSTEIAPSCLTIPASLLPPQNTENSRTEKNWRATTLWSNVPNTFHLKIILKAGILHSGKDNWSCTKSSVTRTSLYNSWEERFNATNESKAQEIRAPLHIRQMSYGTPCRGDSKKE